MMGWFYHKKITLELLTFKTRLLHSSCNMEVSAHFNDEILSMVLKGKVLITKEYIFFLISRIL